MKKFYKNYIIKALLLVLISISFSCRIAKKDWVKENFTSRQETGNVEQRFNSSTEEIKKQQVETIDEVYKEFQKSISNKENTTTNETTKVSGTITAEDGKEKSITVGNTSIKSNGAEVTFETINNKTSSKEYEDKYNSLNKELQSKVEVIQNLESKVNSIEIQLAELKSNYESEKNSKEKNVKTSGFTFETTIFIIIGLIVLVTLIYYRLIIFRWINKLKTFKR